MVIFVVYILSPRGVCGADVVVFVVVFVVVVVVIFEHRIGNRLQICEGKCTDFL